MICTTCPEKPHCGNCGVPFMNSTTSFDFTSLSMNCSMLIFTSFCLLRHSPSGTGPINPTCHICTPNRCAYKAKWQRSGYAPASRAHCPQAFTHSWPTPGSSPGEAFIPGGTPYLGQAVLGELIRHSNVLFP